MSVFICCEKCGKEFEIHPIVEDCPQIVFGSYDYYTRKKGKDDKRYDVCEDCYKELKETFSSASKDNGGKSTEKANLDVRIEIKRNLLNMSDVAKEVNYHPNSFSRLMKEPLSPEKKAMVMAAIERLVRRNAFFDR